MTKDYYETIRGREARRLASKERRRRLLAYLAQPFLVVGALLFAAIFLVGYYLVFFVIGNIIDSCPPPGEPPIASGAPLRCRGDEERYHEEQHRSYYEAPVDPRDSYNPSAGIKP